MGVRVRIASWNIAGGRKIKSLKRWDYEREGLKYFIGHLKKISPDVVCLQETHSSPGSFPTQVQTIASGVGMQESYECVMSDSHIDTKRKIGIAIISRLKINEVRTHKYEYPWFKLLFPDRREAKRLEKYLMLASVNGFNLANTLLHPLHLWGYSYDRGEGYKLAQKYQKLFLALKRPLIMCGDINTNSPGKVYSNFFKKFGLSEALPNVITRPSQEEESRRSDHIFHSDEFELVSSDIIKTKTDHYLCTAELKLKPN